MELRNINTFLRIVDLKQFSKAASELGYAQSTVTSQIHQLEEELGSPLFDRLNNTVALTEFGRAFLPLAQKMYNTEKEMQALSQNDGEVRGTIRIGIVESIFYSDFLFTIADFARQFPKVSLAFYTGSSQMVQQMLLQNEVDMIVCLKQNAMDSKIVIAFSKICNLTFVTNQKNALSSDRLYTLEEIAQQPLVIMEDISIYTVILRQMFDERGIVPERSFNMQSTHGVINLICDIGGVSYVPDYVAQKQSMKGTLRQLWIDAPEKRVTVITGYHRDKWVSPQMHALMALLRNQRWL